MSASLTENRPVEIWSGKDQGDENFPVSRIVRRKWRPHVNAYYAFARNADDIADHPDLSANEKISRLDLMEAVLLGHADHGSPTASRLRDSLAVTGIDPRHATDLLVAFRRDAIKHRYESWDELLDYCRYSAMPVGRYMLDLHGESRQTYPSSDALCASLQVLNHLQDCGKDLASLDRCYLPADILDAHGARIADLRRSSCSPALRQVLDDLLNRTERLNVEAAPLSGLTADRWLRVNVAMIHRLAERLAQRLRHGDPLARRVKLRCIDIALSLFQGLRAL
ncbi:Farnesyl-diphosphate farnesyltransferase [Granulibacter bethesdensis]|uniref:Farnesyl-diphosphate farnesyltransferase n=1 Tax=Granulibacter bethesdensis TaxID=364410 RepID=A0AAN0VGT4_9PROT|nr:squalene synthase HpnC [Granulibacter bethesdensis]AHJ63867.1 Farnesyl-diphosphate farnesyltransferase [Granulibacter bethesdensis]